MEATEIRVHIGNKVLGFDTIPDSLSSKIMGINVLIELAKWIRDGYPDCYKDVTTAVFELMFDLPWSDDYTDGGYTTSKNAIINHEHFNTVADEFYKKFGYSLRGYFICGSSMIPVEKETFSKLPTILEKFMNAGVKMVYTGKNDDPVNGKVRYTVMQGKNETDMHLMVHATDKGMDAFIGNDWDDRKVEVDTDCENAIQFVKETLEIAE